MGQHVLDGAGRCGDTKDEHQRKTFNVAAAEKGTAVLTSRLTEPIIHIYLINDVAEQK